MRIGYVLVLMASGCTVGDGSDPTPEKVAKAEIAPTTGNTVTGIAQFSSRDGEVTVAVTVSNAPEGTHGFHIHQNPACGNDGMDAGPHWDGGTAGDPTTHGLPDSPARHLGDLGNIIVAADGTGALTSQTTSLTVGDGAATDVVGRAVIFHQNADDGTMPSAGARHGCGVIAMQ